MAKRSIVTLTTDFGTADPYVAAMKGVILTRSPHANIVDITHEVPPQDIASGAFVLAQAAPHFPPETVHVVVVDPGVGTDRRIIAARFGGQLFLVPDNGIITFIAEVLPLEQMAVVVSTQFLPPDASLTFHGRDIFAPIASHLLNGLNIAKLGPVPSSYKMLDIAAPDLEDGQIVGQVIHVDRFGNLISNISSRSLAAAEGTVTVTCGGQDVGEIKPTYGMADSDTSLALVNSMGYVEVAVNRGRACDRLSAGVGTEVRIVAK